MTKLAGTRSWLALGIVAFSFASSSCTSPGGDSTRQKQAAALTMRDRGLSAIYEERPELRRKVDEAPGYAVFHNFSIHPGLFSFASGYGVITSDAKADPTHVKWKRLMLGPGIAAKRMYVLVLFKDPEAVKKFEQGPWGWGSQFEAGFVFGDFGGSLDKGLLYGKGAEVEYVTHTGVALQAELIGVGKVSRNDELNRSAAGPPPAASGARESDGPIATAP